MPLTDRRARAGPRRWRDRDVRFRRLRNCKSSRARPLPALARRPVLVRPDHSAIADCAPIPLPISTTRARVGLCSRQVAVSWGVVMGALGLTGDASHRIARIGPTVEATAATTRLEPLTLPSAGMPSEWRHGILRGKVHAVSAGTALRSTAGHGQRAWQAFGRAPGLWAGTRVCLDVRSRQLWPGDPWRWLQPVCGHHEHRTRTAACPIDQGDRRSGGRLLRRAIRPQHGGVRHRSLAHGHLQPNRSGPTLGNAHRDRRRARRTTRLVELHGNVAVADTDG